MPNLALQPGTPPVDSALPDTPQALLNFVAAYLGVSGLENLTGVILSPTEPLAAERDKVWVKKDISSDRALGFYVYNGGWIAVPFIVPSGDVEPAGPKLGELFYNKPLKALRFYDGARWTTNTFHSGDTASRPTAVPVNYLYFDTEIGRLLRNTEHGWSTFDGTVGDVKMVAGVDKETAEKNNPGWSAFTDMAGRFPLGADEDAESGTNGGVTLAELKLKWEGSGSAAQRGNQEQPFVSTLKFNDVSVASGSTTLGAATTKNGEIDLTPPYKALLFLRKDF